MKFFFYLLILLLPTQLGRHFWPNFSFIQGIRVDYLSPTVYLTDILVIALFIVWFLPQLKVSNIQYQISNIKLSYLSLVVLALIGSILIGIYFSASPLAGLYGVIKLVEFSLFVFYLTKTITNIKQIGVIILLLVVGLVFESFLTIVQFLNQSSVGGIFWLFGERTFTLQTIGIAKATINGELILRPYATFPHPNVLAGFMVVVMSLIITEIKYQKLRIKKLFFIASLIVGTLALLLTLSRAAITVWLLVVGIYSIIHLREMVKEKFLILLFVFLVLFLPFQSRFTNFSIKEEALLRREELTRAAIAMVKTQPLVGVGLNNFLVNLPQFQQTKSTTLYLQPVHNIYLLIAAQLGMIGLAFFLWFIVKTYQKLKTQKARLKTQLLISLSAILILGLFDHYWFTLQQGQLLFSLTLGLGWIKIKR